MSDRPWLNAYPEGVPSDIDTSQYPSLVALMEEAFAKRVQQLQDQRRSDLNKASDNDKARINKQYDDTLKIEMEYQAQSLAEYEKFTAKKKELDADWRVGALRAIAGLTVNSRNASGAQTLESRKSVMGFFFV